jgi:hypothetical protein
VPADESGPPLVAASLTAGTRSALEALADTLAQQLDEHQGDALSRLSLVRAFLAVLRDIESFDRARVREARLAARQLGPAGRPAGLVDELRARRNRKRSG